MTPVYLYIHVYIKDFKGQFFWDTTTLLITDQYVSDKLWQSEFLKWFSTI